MSLSAADFKSIVDMSVAAALSKAANATTSGRDGDGASPTVLPSDKQAHETNRLKGVQSLFTLTHWEAGQDKASLVSAANRLETFATNFMSFLSRDHFVLCRNSKLWSIAVAKHFVCADWSIGGGASSIGLHYFSPSAKISCVHEFTIACGIWAECENWLRGPHMKEQINTLHMRLIMLTYDEPRIGGVELATCVEVMAMDLRQNNVTNSNDGVDSNTPTARVSRALPIPISPHVTDERTLSRFLRMGAFQSTSREGLVKGRVYDVPKVGLKRPRDDSKPVPRFKSDPDHKMCWSWIQKGEPKTGCPTTKGQA